MSDEKIFYQILQSREDRALKQEQLVSIYNNPIISFTLNIPGPIKDSKKYRKIHDVGMDAIVNILKESDSHIKYMERIDLVTGPEGYFSVDINPLLLKKLTVKIETEHQLGRLFDIDVFDSNMGQISRSDLGLDPRTCLLCEKRAKVCNKARTHKLEELIQEIDNIYNLYFVNG